MYVFVDTGNLGRLKKILEEHKKCFEITNNVTKLIVNYLTSKVATIIYNQI
jgi:hypothetical protein